MRTVFALLLFAPALTAAPVPKALKKVDTLGGEWVVVEWFIDDSRMQLTDDIRWAIDGDRLTVTSTRQAVPDGFVANATRTVKRPDGGPADAIDYDIQPTDGTSASHRPAVFELSGDTFKLCMTSRHNGPRPAGCTPAEGTIMYVLKRADDKSK